VSALVEQIDRSSRAFPTGMVNPYYRVTWLGAWECRKLHVSEEG